MNDCNCYLCNKQQISLWRFEQLDGDLRPICSKCFYKLYTINFPYDYCLLYLPESDSIRAQTTSSYLFGLNLFSYKDLKKSQKYRFGKIKFNAGYLYAFRIGV
jgi:hypothetical protein